MRSVIIFFDIFMRIINFTKFLKAFKPKAYIDQTMFIMFSTKDLNQIAARGITMETIEQQILDFKNGYPFTRLQAPATRENGIRTFNEKEIHELITNFDRTAKDMKLVKFVPASGAATRMFKHLFEFRELTADKNLADEDDFNSAGYFFKHLNRFAFLMI